MHIAKTFSDFLDCYKKQCTTHWLACWNYVIRLTMGTIVSEVLNNNWKRVSHPSLLISLIKCFYTFITCTQYDRQKMLPFVSKDNRNNNCYWFYFSFSWDINVFNVVVGNYVFRKCLQKDANNRKQLKPFVYCIKIISAVAFFGGHTVAISYFTNYSGKN